MGLDYGFLNKIDKMIDSAIANAAEEVAYKIEQGYEDAVENFYGAYAPAYYDRTESTYLASDGYRSTASTIKKTGDGYTVGIMVDAGNIGGNPYHDPVGYVFNRTYVSGIHGMAGICVSTSPKSIMDAWFSNFCSSELPNILNISLSSILGRG